MRSARLSWRFRSPAAADTLDEFDRVWTPSDPVLAPGEGVRIQFPAETPSSDGNITLSLSGYRPTDDTELVHALPATGGFAILGSSRGLATPQRLTTDLGFPAVANDTVYRFNTATQTDEVYTFDEFELKWMPKEPEIGFGQAFLLTSGARAAGSVWVEARGSSGTPGGGPPPSRR